MPHKGDAASKPPSLNKQGRGMDAGTGTSSSLQGVVGKAKKQNTTALQLVMGSFSKG